jgi:hypothetical protein
MADVSFSYRLIGTGWASAFIDSGGGPVEFGASYFTDALGDLLNAVRKMLLADTSSCSWNHEPTEYRWKLSRIGSRLQVRVLEFEDIYDRAPDSEGMTLIEATCDALLFASEVERAARQLLSELGREGYEKAWRRFAFPDVELELLTATIRSRLGRSP